MEDKDNLFELKNGWEDTTLGRVIHPSDKKVEPSTSQEVPYVGLEHIEKDTGKLLGFGSSSEVKSTKSKFHPGDLLYGKLRPYLNKVVCIDFEGVCSTDILVFSQKSHISNKFLAFRFLSRDFVRYACQNVNGVQHPRVNFQALSKFPISLPPLNEQRRIVAKIEALSARSQRVKEALEDIPQLLDQFRQSVLAAAFRGDLTADWREKNPDVEPASVLLERIRAERRRRWEEAELEKMKTSGKTPKDDKWKEKYKEPESVDDSKLPELPDGWCWVTAEECTSLITDGEHATPERSDDGVYLLSARNILNGRLSFEKVDFVPETVYQKLEKRLKIEAGDIFLSCSGSVGRSCIVPPGLRCALVRSVAVLRPLLKMGEYLSLAIRSPYLQAQIEQKKTHTAQANIFQGRIKTLVIAVAPFEEQKIIVNSIAQAFKYIESIEKTLDDVSNQSTTLDQSILAKAFRGELVAQDPNDEPASVLLERIRAERDKLNSKTAKKSPNKTGGDHSTKAQLQDAEPIQLELGLE